jgi:hypothetical protein
MPNGPALHAVSQCFPPPPPITPDYVVAMTPARRATTRIAAPECPPVDFFGVADLIDRVVTPLRRHHSTINSANTIETRWFERPASEINDWNPTIIDEFRANARWQLPLGRPTPSYP